ncbi:glycerol-3-phosphate acyltransferase [Thermus tengchongensis]|uniref:Glycerol-3-phosphate acyltransferase n=1 Tax=Thermus tengchongensis TaxID=1214928 RepID=A0A4Y9F223_9DEIN|nr:glycerol-3-phosphate acyltransferase [Thermus tengchongensis]TFU18132.1 dehydrogenase [Thermus tengchongensis]TFU27414.1 dehydrogenase [Thermus tengchongensis]
MMLLLLPLSFALGALPFGYWLARRWGVDLRTASPYTLGLETALRRSGLGLTLLAFLLDFAKGYLPMALGRGLGLGLEELLALGVAVYLGHLYPLFFRDPWPLRAKGAGVLLGVLAGLPLDPALGLVPVALGLVLYALTGYASLGALGLPLGLLGVMLFGGFGLTERLLALLLFLLALWRYKENLGRILEGTEPKLGSPLPLPSERQVVCAFLIHPLTVEDFWQSPRFRWARPLVRLGLLKQAWIERLAELFRPMKVGEVRGVKTADGREILCHLISAPLLPHQIKAKPDLAVRRAIQGARLAQELGATVVGLGAFWSVVGEKGKAVQEAVPGIEVTNGGAYTAGTVKAAIPAILAHFAGSGKDLKRTTAAVVGANGVVAFGIARQIAPLVGRLILVGRDRERLERAAESLKRNLERKGQAPEILVTTEVAAIREADLVFTATSDPNPVIFPQHVKPGAWIYDEGVPPDVHPSVREVPGVRVIPGGVVRLPGRARATLDLHFGAPDQVPACLAETMILAAEEAFDRKSLGGEVKGENIQFFVERAEALGFRVVE